MSVFAAGVFIIRQATKQDTVLSLLQVHNGGLVFSKKHINWDIKMSFKKLRLIRKIVKVYSALQ